MLKIVQAPHQVLSEKAKSVAKIDKTIRDLLNQMEVTLDNAQDPEGVGLAAPQVGRSLQLFIIKQTRQSPLHVFINPKVEETYKAPAEVEQAAEERKKQKGVQLEGCLSLANIWGVVKREYGVVLSYQDEQGVQHKRKFEGFIATIIQHECDHLQGTLFPKRVLEQHNQLYKSKKNSKGEADFVEIEI